MRERKGLSRYRVYIGFICLITAVIVGRLFYMQIIKGSDYLVQAEQRQMRSVSIAAPRGEILDRYGRPLVANKVGYAIQIQKTNLTDAEFNAILLRLDALIREHGGEVTDTLPISAPPYTFTFLEDNAGDAIAAQEAEKAWKTDSSRKYPENIDANEAMERLAERYHVSDTYTPDQVRRIVGLRYEMEISGFSVSTPYTILQDASMALVTRLKEEQADFPCVNITNEYVRQYTQGSLAAHILGRVGKISPEEYEELDGYKLNDILGKQGIEKEMETFLRGTDGSTRLVQTPNGFEVSEGAGKDPIPGDSVILTIDMEMQKILEESLGRTIADIRERGGDPSAKSGGDAECGAAVVLDVNSAEVLAMATWPTFDPATYNENYAALSTDPNKPFWNRAISAAYPPGSTFKMLTSIAALESGTITTDTVIRDEGIYRYYDDYQPKCWIYTKQHRTHGDQNVTQAITNSCNYFFYETGRLMGIETLNEYAYRFGLGQRTGIELASEESKGRVAGPEDRKNNNLGIWNPGDTLQAAIGQSENLLTPLQLANYVATLVNGGTRYRPHLVKAVRSSVDGSTKLAGEPEVVEQIDMQPQNLQAVLSGMLGVTEDGTASSIFRNYPISVGGKTGSAQVASGSDNGVFVGYAPFDDPQIVVVVVIEHGNSGSDVAPVARDILDYYFLSDTDPAVEQQESGTLLP